MPVTNTVKTRAVVRFSIPGMHYWADASGPRSYLAAPHRHLFLFTVEMDVEHDDREVEFHDLRDVARSMAIAASFGPKPDRLADLRDFGSQSCESIARFVALHLSQRYGVKRRIVVTVSEDGEVDGVVELIPATSPCSKASR